MKSLKQTLLVETNLTRDQTDKQYFDIVFEVEKIKKEFDIESPGKFVTLSDVSGKNQSRISSLKKSTLEEFPWYMSSGRMMQP